jgi:diaminopimelate epimerase
MGRLAFQSLILELDGLSLPATAVSLGNPHCVILKDDLSQILTLGPQLETAPAFPQRTNVQLMQIIGPHEIRIEIWERGAGYTRASGSSSCAAAGAAVWLGHCRSPVTVQMAGGAAIVHIDADWQAEMIGAVSPVFKGRLAADLYSRLENLT